MKHSSLAPLFQYTVLQLLSQICSTTVQQNLFLPSLLFIEEDLLSSIFWCCLSTTTPRLLRYCAVSQLCKRVIECSLISQQCEIQLLVLENLPFGMYWMARVMQKQALVPLVEIRLQVSAHSSLYQASDWFWNECIIHATSVGTKLVTLNYYLAVVLATICVWTKVGALCNWQCLAFSAGPIFAFVLSLKARKINAEICIWDGNLQVLNNYQRDSRESVFICMFCMC